MSPGGSGEVDTDGDGCHNFEDDDDDDDGVLDDEDPCPLDKDDNCGKEDDYDSDGDDVLDADDECPTSSGPAENDGCPYVCWSDEVGDGQEPCTPCGDGQAPNEDRTACVVCEHGESNPPGECKPDLCKDVSCGANASCSYGVCHCDKGFEDPDNDGQCNKKCAMGKHDPDADGVCTKVCNYDDNDLTATLSLAFIPPEPWERGDLYACKNKTVVVGKRVSGEHTNEACKLAKKVWGNVEVVLVHWTV